MVDASSLMFGLNLFELFQLAIGLISILGVLVFYFGFLVSRAQGVKPDKFWTYFFGAQFIGFTVITIIHATVLVLFLSFVFLLPAEFFANLIFSQRAFIIHWLDQSQFMPFLGILFISSIIKVLREISENQLSKITVGFSRLNIVKILDLEKNYDFTGLLLLVFGLFIIGVMAIFSVVNNFGLLYFIVLFILLFVVLTYLADIYGCAAKRVKFVSIKLVGQKKMLTKQFVRDERDRLIVKENDGQIVEINFSNIESFSYFEFKKKLV